MNDIYEAIASVTGFSIPTAALCTGITLGFILRSLLHSRVQVGPSTSRGISRHSKISDLSQYASINAGISSLSNMTINTNGQSISLNGEQMKTLADLLATGDKISAIKELREYTNLGLAESKSLIELLEGKWKAER